jgi:serine protease Do
MGDPTPFLELQEHITRIAQEVIPSVVHVEVIQKENNRNTKVRGSGFVLSSDGYIVTNEHVVSKAVKVEISLMKQKRKIPAKVVGTDKLTDIALLKIDPEGIPLKPVKLGDDSKLQVGEWVMAVGNPYGLDGSVSFGIVSAKGRNLPEVGLLNDFIQTDALIDYGSSGGPLVNLSGEVVGINSMGQGRGIGFTIPISTVKEVVERLKNQSLERGWLGVVLQPFSRDLAEYLGNSDLHGVLITQIFPDSPAEKAGLQPEDLIVFLEGIPVEAEEEEDINQFRRLISNYPPGQTVTLTIFRKGKTLTKKVTLGKQPKVEGEEWETPFGFTLKELTELTALELRLKQQKGVIVSYVERGSPGSEGGVREGDLLVEVEGKQIITLEDAKKAFQELEGKSRFMVKVQRGEGIYWHLIRPFQSSQKGEK